MSRANAAIADAQIEAFVTRLRRRQCVGMSLDLAKETLMLLRQVIAETRTTNAVDLLQAVRSAGQRLQAAAKTEYTIGNMVKRVLHIIREEANATDSETNETDYDQAATRSHTRGPSLVTLLEGGRAVTDIDDMAPGKRKTDTGPHGAKDKDPRSSTCSSLKDAKDRDRGSSKSIKHPVLDAVTELIDELDVVHVNIAEQALEHVHSNEVILTFGMCKTVYRFLREAAKKRKFQVVVAEGAPDFRGQQLARSLAEAGIMTTAIPDAAVFAMMARVHCVIVGGHAVLADGGMLGQVGLNMVALAAQRHAVPFVALTGLYKLTPLFPHDPEVKMNDLRSPAEVLNFDVIADSLPWEDGQGVGPDLHVPNPQLDYVPPKLVSLYITDTGGHCPSYVYRLLTEYYSPEDLSY